MDVGDDGMWVEVTAKALGDTMCFHLPSCVPVIHHEKSVPQAATGPGKWANTWIRHEPHLLPESMEPCCGLKQSCSVSACWNELNHSHPEDVSKRTNACDSKPLFQGVLLCSLLLQQLTVTVSGLKPQPVFPSGWVYFSLYRGRMLPWGPQCTHHPHHYVGEGCDPQSGGSKCHHKPLLPAGLVAVGYSEV